MSQPLSNILGYEAMLGVVERVKSGVPSDWLPPAYLRPTKTVPGHTAQYTRVDGTRTLAQQVVYGAPSKRMGQEGVTKVPVGLIHTFHDILHETTTLMQVMDLNNEARQNMGMQEVDRQTGQFFRKLRDLRVSTVASALALGAIYFDGDGNLLPSSSGAKLSIDFGVPAGNKTQLDILGDGSIIDASWATAGTDIVGQCTEIKRSMLKKSGWQPTTAFYGANIPGYLSTNTSFTSIIRSNPAVADSFKRGVIPPDTAGLNWVPGGDAFYVDADGTIQSWIGDDTVVFAPDPSPDWWQFLEGTYPVPTDLGAITETAIQQMGSIQEVAGFFSYCKVLDNPVTIQQFAGDTFLPLIASPYAVAIADVTP